MIVFKKQKFECCKGLMLWLSKKWCVEIWYFPSGYKIKPHFHPNENIEVLYLFGSASFYRIHPDTEKKQEAIMNFIPKFLTVPAGWVHGFKVGRFPLIAINFANFVYGYSMSASKDIIVIESEEKHASI